MHILKCLTNTGKWAEQVCTFTYKYDIDGKSHWPFFLVFLSSAKLNNNVDDTFECMLLKHVHFVQKLTSSHTLSFCLNIYFVDFIQCNVQTIEISL